jgi:hypothetical protein
VSEEPIEEGKSNRRRFLRMIGLTLGAAVGAAAIPAAAHAAFQCCPDFSGCGVSHPCNNTTPYHCTCPDGSSYCTCKSSCSGCVPVAC